MADSGGRVAKSRVMTWLTILIVVAAVPVLLVVFRVGFDLWKYAAVPADAPRIVVSLEDTWLNDLGITRATYEQAMIRAGGNLIMLEPDDAGDPRVDPERIRTLLADKDGLLLTGGGDVDPALYGGDPEQALLVNRLRDDFEIALIHEARRRGLPILGICRGCQILNVAHGGTLRNLRSHEDLKDQHFRLRGHAVRLEPGTIVSRVFGSDHLDRVLSFHGQAVDQSGESVRIATRSEDEVVEAIEVGEGQDDWIVSVQWHPEMTIQDNGSCCCSASLSTRHARRASGGRGLLRIRR